MYFYWQMLLVKPLVALHHNYATLLTLATLVQHNINRNVTICVILPSYPAPLNDFIFCLHWK